jgi:homogentisate 1,2-dioxygenase
MASGYMCGFANTFETETLPAALPVERNSPQKINYGLYAERLPGSSFTALQALNQRSSRYRIRPTVRHVNRFTRLTAATFDGS